MSDPRQATASGMTYQIIGSEIQLLEVDLQPGESLIAEAGAMAYMEEGIEFEARMGDGSQPNQGVLGALMGAGKRLLTGESIFMTHFTNHAGARSKVGFAAPFPGQVLPMHLNKLGGELLCQKSSFLAAAKGTEVGIAFTKRFGAGLFGGEGFILQRLRGNSLAFIHAGGTVVQRQLTGQTIRVDTGCLVAFTPGIEYDIQRAGNLKSMLFGGEGLFLATLKGHGSIWLQSMPISRLADRIMANAPGHGGKARGEGSILGGLGRMIDGD